MSELITIILKSGSPQETQNIAESIGRRLRGGEVIELASDLGGGKTTFVRGLAQGMGSLDKVSSPTFTVSKLYSAGELALHHFDFYRLPEAGLMNYELHDLLTDPKAIIVVEWADVVSDVLPEERLRISFTQRGEADRELHITYPQSYTYIMENK